MGNNYYESNSWRKKFDSMFFAIVVILVGVFFLGRNLGFINYCVFDVFISWQMLLIALGVRSLIRQNYTSAVVLLGIGVFFLLPEITCRGFMMGQFWPVLLIAGGLLLLFKRKKKSKWHGWDGKDHARAEYNSVDGFVTSDVTFGSAKHIVLDPVFKGGNMDCTFGNTTLDLRRSTLEGEITELKVDCSFGSIDIFLPSNWTVITDLDNSFGGYKDTRITSHEMDHLHKLLIRGEVSFGNITLKN